MDYIVKSAWWWPFSRKKEPLAPRGKPAVAKNPSVKSPVATQPSVRKFDPREFKSVYDFYKDIAPAIRMRELGVKELDPNEMSAFRSLESIPVEWGILPDDTNGRHVPTPDLKGSKKIIISNSSEISDKEARSILAHELRHALAKKLGNDPTSSSKLNGLFGFLGIDIKPSRPGYSDSMGDEEMFTTMKQHQYKMYERLRDSIGHAPTADEYFSYIDSMKPSDLYNERKAPVNGYQEIADKARKFFGGRRLVPGFLKAYKNALKSISYDGRGQNMGKMASDSGRM